MRDWFASCHSAQFVFLIHSAQRAVGDKLSGSLKPKRAIRTRTAVAAGANRAVRYGGGEGGSGEGGGEISAAMNSIRQQAAR